VQVCVRRNTTAMRCAVHGFLQTQTGLQPISYLLKRSAQRIALCRLIFNNCTGPRRIASKLPRPLAAEREDPGVAIGTVLEASKLVGVPLFDENPCARTVPRSEAFRPCTAPGCSTGRPYSCGSSFRTLRSQWCQVGFMQTPVPEPSRVRLSQRVNSPS
jgi:hypothetical protein